MPDNALSLRCLKSWATSWAPARTRALCCIAAKLGIAMTITMPIIVMTTIISMRVNARCKVKSEKLKGKSESRHLEFGRRLRLATPNFPLFCHIYLRSSIDYYAKFVPGFFAKALRFRMFISSTRLKHRKVYILWVKNYPLVNMVLGLGLGSGKNSYVQHLNP